MKKLLLIALTLLLSINSFSQSKKGNNRDYSKYEKAKADQVEYIVQDAYWREFVNSTNTLYSRLKKVKRASDITITVVTRFVGGGKKVRTFYKNGKRIGEYIGGKYIDYSPRSSKKNTNRKSSNKNLSKTYFKKEKGDKITYLSEKDFYKKYLNKRSKSNRKIMVVSRLTNKGNRYLLFYKSKKLIGQYINGKYFSN